MCVYKTISDLLDVSFPCVRATCDKRQQWIKQIERNPEQQIIGAGSNAKLNLFESKVRTLELSDSDSMKCQWTSEWKSMCKCKSNDDLTDVLARAEDIQHSYWTNEQKKYETLYVVAVVLCLCNAVGHKLRMSHSPHSLSVQFPHSLTHVGRVWRPVSLL